MMQFKQPTFFTAAIVASTLAIDRLLATHPYYVTTIIPGGM